MKGYFTDDGYMGYVDDQGYLLFESQSAYIEYMQTVENKEETD
jgi:hypothetical protein